MAEKTLKYSVGENITIGGIVYKIVGTDDSTPHPGGYKYWNYYLQAIDNTADRMHVTEEWVLKMMEGVQG